MHIVISRRLGELGLRVELMDRPLDILSFKAEEKNDKMNYLISSIFIHEGRARKQS